MASLFVLAVPSHVTAASVIVRDHENFTDSFPDKICGIEGATVLSGVDNFTLFSDNTFRDNFELNLTFTATGTQKSIVFHVAQHVTGNDAPIDNGDRTVTFIRTFKGLPEQIRIAHGPLLLRDAGNVTITDTFAVDANGNITNFVSRTLSGLHGPHPDLLSGIFCDVITGALS